MCLCYVWLTLKCDSPMNNVTDALRLDSSRKTERRPRISEDWLSLWTGLVVFLLSLGVFAGASASRTGVQPGPFSEPFLWGKSGHTVQLGPAGCFVADGRRLRSNRPVLVEESLGIPISCAKGKMRPSGIGAEACSCIGSSESGRTSQSFEVQRL